MTHFRDLQIKRKLTLAILGTTSISLLVACSSFVIYEQRDSRDSMARDVSILADALARNSTVAITYENADDAGDTMQALAAESSVACAGIYLPNGSLFATYTRAGGTEIPLPVHPAADGTTVEPQYLTVVRPVLLKEQRIGSILVRADFTRLTARLRSYLAISTLVLFASLLLAFVLTYALQRLISEPVLALTETARRIAASRDFSERAQKRSGDELGMLTDAFNLMLGQIEERTSALQEVNAWQQKRTVEIRDAATVLASSATQIVAATRQLAAGAANAATAVGETTTTVEEVRHTSQFSSERARFVSDQAQHAAEVAGSGREAVNQTIESMNSIREQIRAIGESIQSLTTQSQAIGEIITTVDDLAAQSKLLSVNAAIEAAKAGAEGKGFSVVALEVKSLAEQSKHATAQVRAILGDIQKATSRAAQSTEQGTRAVETGVRQSASAGESISALADSIAEGAQAATQIAATSREQFAGMEQVAVAMESIKSASAQAVISTKQVEGAARQLQELGEKLQQLAERTEA